MNRPTECTDQIADRMAERLLAGESLFAICQDETMPGMFTFGRWHQDNPQFLDQATARVTERQAFLNRRVARSFEVA